jgi:hypothetical protein
VNPRNSSLVPLAVVLFAPLAGIFVLRAPAFNNLAYRDPWFYSGYGWALAHHIEIFGWFYYAVRFPVILLIGWFSALFGPVAGYLILRYLILVTTGGVLYVCVRRFASPAIASAAVVALALNSFFLRMVLWDYTSFIALPCGTIGVMAWLMASTRGRLFTPFVVSGAVLGAAVFANVFSASFILPLLLVEGVAAVRVGRRELARLALRCGAATLGGCLVFVGGYFAYRAYLGSFSPRDLIEPSLNFVRENPDVTASFDRPVTGFLAGEPRIYAPVILCVALVTLGRGLFGPGLSSRLGQYAVLYVGLLWVSRLLHRSAAVETWWAYNSTAISMCFAAPVLLNHLARTRGARVRIVLAATLGPTAVTTFAIRTDNGSAVVVYDAIRSQVAVLAIVVGVGFTLAVALVKVRSPRLSIAMTAGLFALTAFLSLTPAQYLGVQQTGEFSANGRDERLAYAAAYKMIKLLQNSDEPYSRTLLWTTLVGPSMIAWADLPHQVGGIEDSEAPPFALGHLTRREFDLVRYPTTGELLLLSEDPVDMRRGVAELRRKGAHPVMRQHGTWVDGRLHYALVEVPARTR